MGRLRVTSGPLGGQTIEVTDEIVIGREGVDLEIDDAEISRRHVAVRRLEGALEVEDLGSSNGTFVDGERIESPTRVGGGAQIRLGATVLRVEGVLPVRPSGLPDQDSLQSTRIADPQATRVGGAGAAPIADPQATRVGGAGAAPIADPQSTRAGRIPSAATQATRASAAASDTAGQEVPSAAAQDVSLAKGSTGAAGPPSGSSAGLGPSSGAPASPTSPVAGFSPPAQPRRRGLASRSWVPVALSFGTVIVVAVALVIYFATR